MSFNLKSALDVVLGLLKKKETPSSPQPMPEAPPVPGPSLVVVAQQDPTPAETQTSAVVPVVLTSPPSSLLSFSITLVQLQNITRCKPESLALKFLEHINDTLRLYQINIPLRAAHFMAQVSHESGDLKYTEELASGAAYEGRADLGNTSRGDGVKFKGRGLIQITGRFNYDKVGKSLGVDLVSGDNAKRLAEPELASLSAGWFWDYKRDKFGKNLNDFADVDDFIKIVYFVNGGFNGLADRLAHLKRAYIMLGVPDHQRRIDRIFTEIETNIDNPARDTNKLKALAREIPDHKKLDEARRLVERA